MRYTVYITTLIIILSGFLSTLSAQTNDSYQVILNCENQKRFEVYDTTVTLDYLTELRYESLTNMQILEGFDYPKFRIMTDNNRTVLSNDSIKITLTINLFDSMRFKENYQNDSSLYFKSLYFREFPMEFDYPPFYPKTEISDIKLFINERIVNVSDDYCKDLYNPDLENHKLDNVELFGLNGYVAENKEIILTLFCGEGAGAYKVIFLFDRNGRLIKRINEPVI